MEVKRKIIVSIGPYSENFQERKKERRKELIPTGITACFISFYHHMNLIT